VGRACGGMYLPRSPKSYSRFGASPAAQVSAIRVRTEWHYLNVWGGGKLNGRGLGPAVNPSPWAAAGYYAGHSPNPMALNFLPIQLWSFFSEQLVRNPA